MGSEHGVTRLTASIGAEEVFAAAEQVSAGGEDASDEKHRAGGSEICVARMIGIEKAHLPLCEIELDAIMAQTIDAEDSVKAGSDFMKVVGVDARTGDERNAAKVEFGSFV